MKYVPRPGVVLTKVCGSGLLVPNRQASEFCPAVLRLPLLHVAFWSALCQGKSVEELYQIQQVLGKKSFEESKQSIDQFIKLLCDNGFLIAVEEET